MTNAKAHITRHKGIKPISMLAQRNSLRSLPFGPEPFGNELKAELLMVEGRPLR